MEKLATVTSPVLDPMMQAYPDVPLIEATVSLTGPKPAVTSWTAVSIPCCTPASVVVYLHENAILKNVYLHCAP